MIQQSRVFERRLKGSRTGVHPREFFPEEAPIIYVGGPWQVTLYDTAPRLRIGREDAWVLAVCTPGLGAGTTAYIGYEGIIPEEVYRPSRSFMVRATRCNASPAGSVGIKHLRGGW